MHDCPACTTPYPADLPACPNCGQATKAQGAGPPLVVVECPNADCVAYGVGRQHRLNRSDSWVVELPRLLCATCGFDMKVTRHWPPEEGEMPKITAHGGASFAGAEPAEAVEVAGPAAGGPTDVAPAADAPTRPIVNAPKADWLAYAEAAYDVDQAWADSEYNKADLITAVGALEAGGAVVVDGKIVTDDDG